MIPNVRNVNKVVNPNRLNRFFVFCFNTAIFCILTESFGWALWKIDLIALGDFPMEFCSIGRDCFMGDNSDSEFAVIVSDLLANKGVVDLLTVMRLLFLAWLIVFLLLFQSTWYPIEWYLFVSVQLPNNKEINVNSSILIFIRQRYAHNILLKNGLPQLKWLVFKDYRNFLQFSTPTKSYSRENGGSCQMMRIRLHLVNLNQLR